jgi:hypothetical protein
MILKYAERPSESLLFRDNFINDDYVEDNGGTFFNSLTADNGITTNGSNQYISYCDCYDLGSGSWSINFKVSIPTAGVQTYLVSKHQDNDNRWYIRIDATGRIFMFSKVATVTVISGTSGVSITEANTEYNIEVVGDRDDTLRFYVDGAESTGTVSTFTAVNLDNTGNFEIGRWNVSYGAFTMRDLSLYNLAHTNEEVSDVYQDDAFREIDASKAFAWLPCRTYFDDDSNIVTENIGTGVNAYWGDGDGTNEPDLVRPHGMLFDGTAKWIIADASVLRGDTTVGAMIRIDNWNETLPRIFYNGSFIFAGDSSNERLSVTSDGSTTAYSANNSIQLGTYYFVTVTRESDGTANFHISGELSGTADQPSGTPDMPIIPLVIGSDQGSRHFNGYIGTPFVFRSILTPTQIRELSNKAFNNLNV